MGRILSFLGSLGIALIVTAAGAIIDAKPLLYGGILLVALVAILWLWMIVRPQPVPALAAPPEPDWTPESPADGAILALKRARDCGRAAYQSRSEREAYAAVQEIQAALLSIETHFDFGRVQLTGDGTNLQFLYIYLHYLDVVYPRLRAGQVDAAKARAKAFNWVGS